jgi:mono/diheme cytochrome c family protein
VGSGEIDNPGSRWGSVPRWGAGNALMYAHDSREIEEFIRFGAPRSWLEQEAVRQRLQTQRLVMPAYEDRLSDREIADLVAFVLAGEGFGLDASDPVAAGRSLARKLGCPSCHGPEGGGGVPNRGSLGGFVPGFLGRNFADLVTGEEEFAEWVRTGTSRRLGRNPVVRWFWDRQQIQMPSFDLSDEELEQLWAWVQAARRSFLDPPPQADPRP